VARAVRIQPLADLRGEAGGLNRRCDVECTLQQLLESVVGANRPDVVADTRQQPEQPLHFGFAERRECQRALAPEGGTGEFTSLLALGGEVPRSLGGAVRPVPVRSCPAHGSDGWPRYGVQFSVPPPITLVRPPFAARVGVVPDRFSVAGLFMAT